MSQRLKTGILIVSETASQDPSTDKCISVLQKVFEDLGHEEWEVSDTKIVPDSVLDIQRTIQGWTDHERRLNLIITSGGTGFAINDVTPEAISPLLHKQAPGLIHGMLASSLTVTPFALMARPVAGVRNKTLIITLPGSPKGAKENLEAIIKLLPHACSQISGANSRMLHAGGVKKLEKDAGLATHTELGISSKPAGQHSHHHHHHGHGHDHGHGAHRAPVAHIGTDHNPKSNDPAAGPSRRYRASPYPMISVDEALKLISHHTPRPEVAKSSVTGAIVGSVLAEDVKAREAVPAFRASIVDGYAVRFPEKGPFVRGIYPVSLVSHAKASELHALQEGQIARITTGAPLPPGADAVVMVEDTVLASKTDDGQEEKEIEILTSDLERGENVREIGSDVQAGYVIMKKGEGITATGGELGLLASVGTKEVLLYKKPIVGVLSTGDEIVPQDKPEDLKLGEVRDTNRPTLLNAARSCGFKTIDFGIASDKPGTLESTLRAAFTRADILITTGGVSMGELDLLKPTIERSLGGTIHFGRVSMKPGKPTTFASVSLKHPETGARISKLIFSLPGNPASAIVTFHLFVLPALHHASGIEPAGLPKVVVRLEHDIKLDKTRAEYHRVTITAKEDGQIWASSTGGQRSSRVGSFKGANGLLILPSGSDTGRAALSKGEKVDALLMDRLGGVL